MDNRSLTDVFIKGLSVVIEFNRPIGYSKPWLISIYNDSTDVLKYGF